MQGISGNFWFVNIQFPIQVYHPFNYVLLIHKMNNFVVKSEEVIKSEVNRIMGVVIRE